MPHYRLLQATLWWSIVKELMSQVMIHSLVIGNMRHWKFNTKPQNHKHWPQFPITGDVTHTSAGVHIPYYSYKRKCFSNKLLPPTSFAQSSNLVKIFWNLQSNLFLCGWPILLCLVLTTMTLNLGNKMMAINPLTIFSWIQSQIEDGWKEKALGWPNLWTSQKVLPHSRDASTSTHGEKLNWPPQSPVIPVYHWIFWF